jgi:hypothetical protein
MKTVHRVALYLNRQNDETFEVNIQSILKSMTNNPNFAGPLPELDDLQTAFKAYQDALVARRTTGSKLDTTHKNEMRAALEQTYRALAHVVEAKSKNDITVLVSSGFEIIKPAVRKNKGRLEKPSSLEVVGTGKPGSVKISVSKIEGANSYMYQYALAPVTDESQWKILTAATRSVIIDGLELGKPYLFRAGGIGSDTTIVYSDTFTRFIS